MPIPANQTVISGARVPDGDVLSPPRIPAVGVDDVLVSGVPVLRDGRLTGQLPGSGLRWKSSDK